MKKKLVSLALVASMMFTGCGIGNDETTKNNENENTRTEQSVDDNKFSGEVNKLYGAGDKVTLETIMERYGSVTSNMAEPMYNMSETEKFDFKFATNIGYSSVSVNDLVTVHTDSACLKDSELYTANTYVETEDGGSLLTVSPLSCPLGNQDNRDDYVDNSYTWGNAPIYYIAIWYDMEAEELVKLEEPTIIPFTIQHKAAAPEVKGVVDSQGCFSLQWDKVEGASEYRVYVYTGSSQWTGVSNDPINAAKSGYKQGNLVYINTVDADTTTFKNFAGEGGNIVSMNRNVNGDEYVISQNPCVYGEYYVSAVVNGVESGFACAVPTCDLKIPYMPTKESDILFKTYTDVSQLPATIEVVNIDGSITERNVIYTFKSVETYFDGLFVPEYYYSIEGTALKGYVSMDVEDPNYEFPETIGEGSQTGAIEPEDDITSQPDNDIENVPEDNDGDGSVVDDHLEKTQEDIDNAKEQEIEIPENVMIIFADSAEEEWVALHMAAGESEISLEAFPQLQTKEALLDVINKVYYQNPYVLGLYRYGYDYEAKILTVEYSYTKEEIKTRQAEIMEKADEIIAEVITEDMDEAQKQFAIYKYLEDNTRYDYDVLEKAEENNYKATNDGEMAESFNTYGIMVKGVGVCQSYAYTYKLLCRMAGVECDVVSGYMSGSLPHAWNTVKFSDGWYQVDVTNNETSTGIPYILYNAATTTAAASGYVEDDQYALNTDIEKYYSDNEEYEYYNANDLVAESMDEYQEILVRELSEGEVFISIRYEGEELSQEELINAIKEAYYMAAREDELAGTTLKVNMNFIMTEIQ